MHLEYCLPLLCYSLTKCPNILLPCPVLLAQLIAGIHLEPASLGCGETGGRGELGSLVSRKCPIQIDTKICVPYGI